MTCTLRGMLTVAVAAGLLAGCSSSGGSGSPSGDGGGGRDATRADTATIACKPGTKSACTCPGGGSSGVHVCNTNGEGYGACTGCSTTDATTHEDASDAGKSPHPRKDASVDAAKEEDAARHDAEKTDAHEKDASHKRDASHPKDASHAKDSSGHDATGHDAAGHDATGYDAAGYDATGYDATGYDATGYDATGYDASPPPLGCTFGDHTCYGQQPGDLPAYGTWVDNGTCSGATPACLGGYCVECLPGATECSGNTIEACDGSGQWEPSADCAQPTPACSESGGTTSCICPGGYTICGYACVDLMTDSNNCGGCGVPCTGAGEACQYGTCVPTWTYLWNTYLAAGTPGDCSACHMAGYYYGSCDDPVDCYDFIGNGQWGGLTAGGGLFTWDNGYMPPSGTTSLPQADIDFGAWIAAGSPDN